MNRFTRIARLHPEPTSTKNFFKGVTTLLKKLFPVLKLHYQSLFTEMLYSDVFSRTKALRKLYYYGASPLCLILRTSVKHCGCLNCLVRKRCIERICEDIPCRLETVTPRYGICFTKHSVFFICTVSF